MSSKEQTAAGKLLSTYPIDETPSFQLSNSWKRSTSEVPLTRAQAPDRSRVLAVAAYQFRDHADNVMRSVKDSLPIKAMNRAARINFLQKYWPTGWVPSNIPCANDPKSDKFTYSMYSITKRFVDRGHEDLLPHIWEPGGLIYDLTRTNKHGERQVTNEVLAQANRQDRRKDINREAPEAGLGRSGIPEEARRAASAPVEPSLLTVGEGSDSNATEERNNLSDVEVSHKQEEGDDGHDGELALSDRDDNASDSDDGAADFFEDSTSRLDEVTPGINNVVSEPDDYTKDLRNDTKISDKVIVLDPTAEHSHEPVYVVLDDTPEASRYDLTQETIQRLGASGPSGRLTSSDIHLCLGILLPNARQRDFFCFDVGYPTSNTVTPMRKQVCENNLLFTLHHKDLEHWSVAHIERRANTVNVYDSMAGSNLNEVRSMLQGWVEADKYLSPTTSWKMKDCPKQTDGHNCGIFALEFARCLVNGRPIPSQINPQKVRTEMVERIEALSLSSSSTSTKPIESPSTTRGSKRGQSSASILSTLKPGSPCDDEDGSSMRSLVTPSEDLIQKRWEDLFIDTRALYSSHQQKLCKRITEHEQVERSLKRRKLRSDDALKELQERHETLETERSDMLRRAAHVRGLLNQLKPDILGMEDTSSIQKVMLGTEARAQKRLAELGVETTRTAAEADDCDKANQALKAEVRTVSNELDMFRRELNEIKRKLAMVEEMRTRAEDVLGMAR